MSELTKISVKLRPHEIAALDKLAKARAWSRSEALRAAFATGRHDRVTLCVAVLLSYVEAITLAPARCAPCARR